LWRHRRHPAAREMPEGRRADAGRGRAAAARAAERPGRRGHPQTPRLNPSRGAPMPAHVVYPKVSLEKASGRIARWIVAEGQAVKRGQVLFEIEDDKAAVEVEAPADGIIGQMVAEDFEVTVGDPVALIFAAGETP